MEGMMAYCGLTAACPAYLATRSDDDAERAKVAKMWTKLFKFEFKPEHINCDGCRAEGGRLFGHCTTCAVRLCGMDKNWRTARTAPSTRARSSTASSP